MTQSGRGYLFRVSASNICNYDCAFCHPNRNEPVVRLSDRELMCVFRAMNDLFVLKTLHFTGGEPLMRGSLSSVIAECRRLAGTDLDIVITTNASMLKDKLSGLLRSGLTRANVSLHSINPYKYQKFTGSSTPLEVVLEGIDMAKASGIGIKVNSVVIRKFNDMDIEAMAEYCFRRNIIPRFLELGIYGPVAKWFTGADQVPHSEILERMQYAYGPFERDFTYRGNGPSKYYKNATGNVFGILDNQSDTLCRGCDRFRMSANGYIKVCNYAPIDLRPYINDKERLREQLLCLVNVLNSRGKDYIGKRQHHNDYYFRWNHPEKNVSQEV